LRGAPYDPGAGGWPTIRYFNANTGPTGAFYEKTTPLPVSDELADYDRMMDYVEVEGTTVLCAVDGTGCDDRARHYLEKIQTMTRADQETQLQKLSKIMLDDHGTIKEPWKNWVRLRKRIILTVLRAEDEEDEL
jgi:hypothetical protein